MKYTTLVLSATFIALLCGCPPERGGGDPPPGGGGGGTHWLKVTELYDGEPGYTSHQLTDITGPGGSCGSIQSWFETFTDAYRDNQEARDALYDEWDGGDWGDVEFVRAYCEIEKALYEELGSGSGAPGAAGQEIVTLMPNHPDSVDGEPVEGTYAVQNGGDDVPVGRGFEAYANGYQVTYHQGFYEAYADAYDCDIESAEDSYFDSSVVGEAATHLTLTGGTLELEASGDAAFRGTLTDGTLVDQDWEDAGTLELSETFRLCEVEYESPWAVPEDPPEPEPGDED